MDTTTKETTGIENKVRPIGDKYFEFVDKETGDVFKFHYPTLVDKSLLEQAAMSGLYRAPSYHAVNACRYVLTTDAAWAMMARLTTLVDECPEWFGKYRNGELKVNLEVFNQLEKEDELMRVDNALREFIRTFRDSSK